MSETHRTKVFKSGNSMALRLPKALGIAEGTEVNVVREFGHLVPLRAGRRAEAQDRRERLRGQVAGVQTGSA